MLCLAPLSTSTWAVTAVVRKQSAHCSEANSSVCTAGAALAQGEGHPTTDQLHHCAPREHCSTCRQPSHLHIRSQLLSCFCFPATEINGSYIKSFALPEWTPKSIFSLTFRRGSTLHLPIPGWNAVCMTVSTVFASLPVCSRARCFSLLE